MTARVLVVDDIEANVKLLEARLTIEYFETLTARSGPEALQICADEGADVVLLDVMMPGMDGFEVCRRLKADPKTQHIPVIMVTALDQPSDKIRGLEAGADDFLTKPVDDLALITRVKNLSRLKMLMDEMLKRASTGEQMGMDQDASAFGGGAGLGGKVLLVEDHARSATRIMETLSSEQTVDLESDPQRALMILPEKDYDLLMVSLSLSGTDGLRLCSQLRSLNRFRQLPILIISEPGENVRLLRGLEMGVNDYLVRPIEKNEMMARVRTQIKRKRYTDQLRNRLEESVEMAITDSLTGLYNRHYMERHLTTLVKEAVQRGKPLSMLIVDIDYFKAVNDTHGHQAGDAVLKDFANRLRENIRGIDLACRLGGEEFVVMMPETDLGKAYVAGERLRQRIASVPFQVSPNTELTITASVGIATLDGADDTPEGLLKRADEALYSAKRDGRNRVVADAA
ncbi:MAG TPA: PleD family two-component system response regulator [Rhizobiales bacterium]|nr:response regulator PleD [bacterium BMS3Bbin10]HDO52969.1 PleD family two-component system response regulator [Hyphomicrobiales bacterium]